MNVIELPPEFRTDRGRALRRYLDAPSGTPLPAELEGISWAEKALVILANSCRDRAVVLREDGEPIKGSEAYEMCAHAILTGLANQWELRPRGGCDNEPR